MECDQTIPPEALNEAEDGRKRSQRVEDEVASRSEKAAGMEAVDDGWRVKVDETWSCVNGRPHPNALGDPNEQTGRCRSRARGGNRGKPKKMHTGRPNLKSK